MSNANNARLVRIAVRSWGSSIDSATPLMDGDGRFQVVVEGKAGTVLGASSQPYSLEISAFDITAAINPHSAVNDFTQRRTEQFNATHGWPHKVAIFTVTVNDLQSVQGHLLRYYAILLSANQIVSFVESPLFLLFNTASGTRHSYGWIDEDVP
jgi:hypothetical protein